MKAVRFDSNEGKLSLTEVPVPKASALGDVLIKVAYAGICGSDLHIIKGEFPCKDKPVTLGHEFSGVVVETGNSVRHVKKGDHVVVDPNNGCQVCDDCHIGNPHFCTVGSLNNTVGIYRDGAWAEYCLVPDAQVIKLPSNITLQQGALCEPLSCLAHGWDKISPITVGQNILVIGAGIIGNLWLVCLHLQGHRRVTVSEPNDIRRNLVQKLNVGYECITPDELKKQQEDGRRFDLIVDCSGFAPAIEAAVEMLKPGGKLCMFGVAPPHAKISVAPYEIFRNELTIIGIKINPFTFPKAVGLLDALGERYLNYDSLGVGLFDIQDYEKAIDSLKKGSISKAVFKL